MRYAYMSRVSEKLKNIKKIADILKSMPAEYVKELVIMLTQKTDYRYSLNGLMTNVRFAEYLLTIIYHWYIV